MKEQERKVLKQTVKLLAQMDKTNLLIVQSGASMLLTRQKMDERKK